jgi:hypothetical protein
VTQCIHCLRDIPEDRNVCPACGTIDAQRASDLTLAAGTVQMGTSPLDRGRFVAGTVLAARYRIIGLLGRGGMGEVYKAEDLKLHQLAALKFLPEVLSSDGAMVARFHREVRTARQITHSNVCRVHDIGQIPIGSGILHFISMEYIDGEDLATLLRRIGHLPAQKGMELARQICSGLSAAHEMGVVHRDLKPANIMLDGRGRVRITDFGLSGLADEIGRDEQSGTPAYMAPEQLNGSPATPESDMYALGLVLYEVFTGKRPFEGRNIAELIDQHRSATPPPPSTRIREIDPLAEKAILRCLSVEPRERPHGPLEVLSALSGGNPLDKVLAAGETPSPEMVAAAGEQTGLRPVFAWACLITIALVCAAIAGPLNPAKARGRTLGLPPDVQIDKARQIGRSLGYPDPVDFAHGFGVEEAFVRYGRQNRNAAQFQSYLDQSRPGGVYFWYIESPATLMPGGRDMAGPVFARPGARVKEEPADRIGPAMIVKSDLQGRLIEFRSFLATIDETAGKESDWKPLLRLAGIDPESVTRVESVKPPPVPFDEATALKGTWVDRPDTFVTVDLAAFHGKPVYLGVRRPLLSDAVPLEWEAARTAVIIGMVIFSMVAGVLLARHNLQAGRGDRRGAFRVSLFAFAVLLMSWVFGSDHRLDPREMNLYLAATGEALYRSVVVGLLYLAVEPFVRQRWPHALISWNRVLEGRFRDPLVGRAVLMGIVFAAGLALLRNAGFLMEVMSPELPEPDLMNAMPANSYSVSFLLGLLFDSVNIPLALFLLFCFLRIVLRSKWFAGTVVIVLINLFVNAPYFETSGIIVATAFGLLWLFGVNRFGLIAGMSLWFADRVFRAWSMLAPAPWYSGRMYLLMAAVVILSIYSFLRSLGDRPLLPADLLSGSRKA